MRSRQRNRDYLLAGHRHTRGTPPTITLFPASNMDFLRHEPSPCNPLTHTFDEKAPPSNSSHSRLFPLTSDSQNRFPPHRAMSGQCSRTPPRVSYTRPRGLRIANLIRSWLPIISYVATTVAFFIAIALYRDQLFASKFLKIYFNCLYL